jgi:hypothetical protein
MYELAFNINGERFELPSTAEFWRPRRVRDRGLEVVYQRDGIVPLILPVDATAAEFRADLGGTPGKYRLDALDAHHQPIEGVPPAYVVIPRSEPAAQRSEDNGAGSPPPAGAMPLSPAEPPVRVSETAALLEKVVTVNAEVMRTIVEQFASVMGASAHLLRAADGAGLPARLPPEPRNGAAGPEAPADDEASDDDNDDQGVAERIENITRNVADVAEVLGPLAALVIGKFGLRNAGATKKETPRESARRNEAPPRWTTRTTGPQPDRAPEPEARSGASDDDVTITPEMMSMLVKVRSRLEPDEVEFISQVYAELTPAEVAHWLRELSALTIDEAVERIRAQIAASDHSGDNQGDEPEAVAS